MKKVPAISLLLGLLLSSVQLLGAQSTAKLFISIPNDNQMGEYLSVYQSLVEFETGKTPVNANAIQALFEKFVDTDTLTGLMVESFLRTTENPEIRQLVIDYIAKQQLAGTFIESLQQRYAATLATNSPNEIGKRVFTYQNKMSAEDFKLFDFNQQGAFNGFGFLLFNNPWGQFSFTPKDGKKDSNSIILMLGGGTNAITVNIKRHANRPKTDTTVLANTSIYKSRFAKDWQVKDLALEGILSYCGGDAYTSAYGLESNESAVIFDGAFSAFIHSPKTNDIYEITYFMNIAQSNIFYQDKLRIYNYLLFQTMFLFVD